MPYDIVDAFTDIQETKAAINAIVESISDIPQIKAALEKHNVLPAEPKKPARRG